MNNSVQFPAVVKRISDLLEVEGSLSKITRSETLYASAGIASIFLRHVRPNGADMEIRFDFSGGDAIQNWADMANAVLKAVRSDWSLCATSALVHVELPNRPSPGVDG